MSREREYSKRISCRLWKNAGKFLDDELAKRPKDKRDRREPGRYLSELLLAEQKRRYPAKREAEEAPVKQEQPVVEKVPAELVNPKEEIHRKWLEEEERKARLAALERDEDALLEEWDDAG
jgi:hypothetical protein